MSPKKMVLVALYVAMAIVLSIVENLMPLPFIAPGVKLGLANVVTMVAIYTLGYREAGFIMLTRVILTSMYGGGLNALLYALTGGVLSLFVMIVLKESLKTYVSPIGISAAGAFFHNFGQILMAAWIIGTPKMFAYMGVLTVSALITGVIVGMTTIYYMNHMKRLDTV